MRVNPTDGISDPSENTTLFEVVLGLVVVPVSRLPILLLGVDTGSVILIPLNPKKSEAEGCLFKNPVLAALSVKVKEKGFNPVLLPLCTLTELAVLACGLVNAVTLLGVEPRIVTTVVGY